MKTGKTARRAQGHIEVILSFTIFIGFLLTIFYFLSPISTNQTSYSSLDRVEEKLLQNLSVAYNQVSLIIKDPGAINEDCFSVNNSVNLPNSFIIRDEEGNIVNSSIRLSDEKILIERKDSRIYYIYYSAEDGAFNAYPLASSSCEALEKSNYSFSAPITSRLVLFENLEAMNWDYIDNYDNIKANLGLEDDFEFIVYNLSRGILMNETISVHKIKISSVLSRNILLKSIDKNASSSGLILNLRVW